MSGEKLTLISSAGPKTFQTLIDSYVMLPHPNGSWYPSSVQYSMSGPLGRSLRNNCRDLYVTEFPVHASYNGLKHRRTEVRHGMSPLDGFDILRRVARGSRKSLMANWNPRMRYTRRGHSGELVEIPVIPSVDTSYKDGQHVHSSHLVCGTRSPSSPEGPATTIYFSRMHDFMLRLYGGSSRLLYRTQSTPAHNPIYWDVTLLLLTDDWIIVRERQATNGFGASFDHDHRAAGRDVTIAVNLREDGNLGIFTSGIGTIQKVTGWDVTASYTNSNVPENYIVHKYSVNTDYALLEQLTNENVTNSSYTIVGGSPALWHTSASATQKAMGDASQNLETLAESAEMLTLVEKALSPEGPLRGHSPISAFNQIFTTLSAAQLTWLFAVRPTIDFILNIKNSVKRINGFLELGSGESSTTFSSDDEVIPNNLREFVYAGWSESYQIHSWKVTFTSHAKVGIGLRALSFIMGSRAEAYRRAGIEPRPGLAWDLLMLSFVFDMFFVNVGSRISDAESWLGAYTKAAVTTAHSISVELVLRDGTLVNAYLRSEASNQLLRPPNDNWTVASGASYEVLVPLLLLAVLR